MFLQLVAVAIWLLFITRTERWFSLPPSPGAPLFGRILLTRSCRADVRCRLVVPAIPATGRLVGAYNIAWMFVARRASADYRRFAYLSDRPQARA